ncbi:MAG TPA: amidohydrolase family protein [Steroidobacteraceae bacterium]|nr:amidohydrolase family protein [Steroidobacteraceae bacterium]
MNPLTFMPLVIVPFLFACSHVRMPADAQCYSGFTAIDPATERRIENAWVVVAGGRIASLGRGSPPRGCDAARTHDLRGKFVLPGFIDAHAHITATGMQQIEVHDGVVTVKMESIDRITKHNARIALARGVTTVRNPGGDPEANARYDRQVASGEWPGPEARHAGAVIEPPPFTGSTFAYPRNDAEWDAEAARQAALGMTYFKLYVDLTEAELAAGIRAAHQHGLEAIAHLNAVSWTRAAELGIDGLEHALPTSADLLEPAARAAYLAQKEPTSKFMYRWFELADYDGPLIRRMAALLAQKKIPVNLTLVVNQLIYNIDDFDPVVPAQEMADALPEVLAVYLPQIKASATGWTPEDFDRARAVFPKVLAFARLLHEAGVPMMIGTDAGGGSFYARELELHVQAGIPEWEVLRLATSKTAALLGMGDRIGRLEPGFEADLVVLDADPLANIGNAAQVHGVLNNGLLLKAADLRRQ